MSWKYPREKKRLIIVNGAYYDAYNQSSDFHSMWEESGDMIGGVADTHYAAPGLSGQYCIRITGNIGNGTDKRRLSVTPIPNKSYQYNISPTASLKWKNRAEFRLRIGDDEYSASYPLSHCAGFLIDGNTQILDVSNTHSTGIYFNSTGDKVGIGVYDKDADKAIKAITTVTQTILDDTWYDVRIEWSYDFLTDPDGINIKVYWNNNKIIDYDIDINDFQVDSASLQKISDHGPVGRSGPTVSCHQDDVGVTGSVLAHFTDILITQEVQFIKWELANAILTRGAKNFFKGIAVLEDPLQLGRGSDITVLLREDLTDDFKGHFRGIVNQVDVINHRFSLVEAEGYASVLYEEKTDKLSFTTQTAATIVRGAINNPDKFEFRTNKFFDTVSTTYTREYIQVPKIDIMLEMAALEGFILFLDYGNFWHFQSYRTNELDEHLIFGRSRITDVKWSDVFIRQPTEVKVIGSGAFDVREVSSEQVISGSKITRSVNRLDLTTQADIDDALDYYASLVHEPLRSLELTMAHNYDLQVGHLIRITATQRSIKNQEFLIVNIHMNHQGIMRVTCLEASPALPMLLSELNKRTSSQEDQNYEQDTEAANPNYNIEGVAQLNITARYVIQKYYVTPPNWRTVREGDMVVTNDCLEDLIDIWHGDTVNRANNISIGSDSTLPKYSDAALVTLWQRYTGTTRTKQEATAQDVGGTGMPTTLYRTLRILKEESFTSSNTIREIGIEQLTSNDLYARAVFSDLLISIADTYRFYIYITIMPTPNACMVTLEGVSRTIEALYDGNNVATPKGVVISHPANYGTSKVRMANMWASSMDGIMVPRYSNDGILTKTKLYDRHMLKFKFEYTYDYAGDNWDPLGLDPPTVPLDFGIVLKTGNTGGSPSHEDIGHWNLVLFRRKNIEIDDYDTYSCKWIIWIKFIRGEYSLAS